MPSRPAPSIGIVGLGHVGLPTGLALARGGCRVLGYDVDTQLRSKVARGIAPYREAGLAPLLRDQVESGRFTVARDLSELAHSADLIFLCVPTPSLPSGRIDLRPLRKAAQEVGTALRDIGAYRAVVVKSTVPPGTTEQVVEPIVRRLSGKAGRRLGFAATPEFLAEGTMVRDSLRPDRIVVGTNDPRAWTLLRRAYRSFRAPMVRLTPSGAELVKYSSNTLLALKLSFANEIARLADTLDTDIDQVMGAVGRDPRLGPAFLRAGPGFGGSCFDKDLRALLTWATDRGLILRTAAAALDINHDQTDYSIELVRRTVGSLRGRRVALLGLAFKEGTEDVRESRALPIARRFVRAGATVRAHDPVASGGFERAWASSGASGPGRMEICRTVERALDGADVAVLHTAWPVYRQWPSRWTRKMRSPRLVDLRRALSPSVVRRAGLQVTALGAGSITPPASAPRARARRR